MKAVVLWVAQGFGIGRIPAAPGTFGSALGLIWVQALLWTGQPWLFTAGALSAIACSVWFCGQAERIIGQTDPGSVVLDEIAALPVCFVGWLILSGWPSGAGVGASLITDGRWRWTLGIYALFRVFDVWKPWPVKQSQALPGGWGVTADDLLAAVYVNLAVVLVWWISGLKLNSGTPPP